MAATIKIKNSSTAGAAPTSSDLVQGELAVNVTDKRLFTENSGGTVVELGTNPSSITLPDGSASAPTLLHSGDTNTGLFFPAADTIALTTGGTERLRLDSSGNLGLGVTPSTWTVFKAQEIGVSGSAIAGYSGGLNFVRNGYYNSGWKYAGTGISTLYEQSASGHAWYYSASGTAGNAITFTQAMTLDASGNFLVGTTTAREQLTVNSAGYFAGDFNNANAANGLYVSGNSSGVSQIRGYNTSGGVLAFFTNPAAGSGAERARIDSSGNLLVGDTSAAGRVLAKSATSDGTTSSYVAKNSSGTVLLDIISTGYFKTGVAANSPYNNATGSAANVFVGSDGALFRSTSSLKYKTNVQDATHGLAEVLQLRSVTYEGKSEFDAGKTFGGLIAEEVHAAGLTEFVQYADDGTPDALAYGNMVSLCIKAIQELKAIVDAQAAEIAALKGQA